MNIEELELSLRTEFESHLRTVLAGIKQEVSAFQEKFEAEFEEHRSKLDRTIAELSSGLPETPALDAAFNESISEHLRLARDDGAQVAAVAFGEAEKLRAEPSALAGGFDQVRDAINEISSKNSQATILQALVEQAAKFATRGAFFIVKNDHFVGWKVFGADQGDVRDVILATSTDTVLAAAIRSMAKATAAFGEYSEDQAFLDALNFGTPTEMHAIPLTARGRGVAVLYADAGGEGAVNVEALETLVRVTGLTVELLAASQAPVPAPSVSQPAEPAEQPQYEAEQTATYSEAETAAEESVREESVPEVSAPDSYQAEVVEQEFPHVSEPAPVVSETYSFEPEPGASETEPVPEEVTEYTGEVTCEFEQTSAPADKVPTVETPAEFETFEPVADAPSVEEAAPATEPVSEFEFSSNASGEAPQVVPTPESEVDTSGMPMVEAPAPVEMNGNGQAEVATVAEPVVEVASAGPKKSRFSDRNVDLPIEVPEAERRLHNDARRFARLLVSEIKLYNEAKVSEGREAGDLYERLKEAIDRSREMYDKRVQPAVASKFDYFHYEVVNSLAEGQESKLGAGYPGATV